MMLSKAIVCLSMLTANIIYQSLMDCPLSRTRNESPGSLPSGSFSACRWLHRRLERAVVDRDAGSGAKDVVGSERLLRSHMHGAMNQRGS